MLDVSINPECLGYFKPIFDDYPDLEKILITDFINYKEGNNIPHYFGRDAAYVKPYSAHKAGLMHIHLALPPKVFDQNKGLYYRTSDTALVYVQAGCDINKYSLLAIFHPDAHSKARNESMMKKLASIAQRFVDEF